MKYLELIRSGKTENGTTTMKELNNIILAHGERISDYHNERNHERELSLDTIEDYISSFEDNFNAKNVDNDAVEDYTHLFKTAHAYFMSSLKTFPESLKALRYYSTILFDLNK